MIEDSLNRCDLDLKQVIILFAKLNKFDKRGTVKLCRVLWGELDDAKFPSKIKK